MTGDPIIVAGLGDLGLDVGPVTRRGGRGLGPVMGGRIDHGVVIDDLLIAGDAVERRGIGSPDDINLAVQILGTKAEWRYQDDLAAVLLIGVSESLCLVPHFGWQYRFWW